MALLAATARAETDGAYFARALGRDDAKVETFAVRHGGGYDRMIVGTGAALLVRCDGTGCVGQQVWLPNGTIEVLGAVDLGGTGAFPTTRQPIDAARMTWPALLVRTTEDEHEVTTDRSRRRVEGTRRRRVLSVISLANEDRASPLVLRTEVEAHGATGAGYAVTFAAARGTLVATEQRDLDRSSRCMRPAPVVVHYKLDANRRFQRTTDLAHRGCG